jgi:hypothetical protein
MNADKTLRAVFEEIMELTIVATGGGYTIPAAGKAIECVKDTAVTLKAIPNDGYEFKGWTGSITDAKDVVRIIMDDDKLIGATFNEKARAATNNKKLYLATVNEKAYWNVDGRWTFFATPRHSMLKELDQDSHPQYHNDERGDERYYTRGEIDAIIAALPSGGGTADAIEVVFTNETIWTIEHNLGRLPVITVWEETVATLGFGTQAFGTTSFGGADAILTENTKIPTITQQGLNITVITWSTAKTGKVVYV